MKTPQLKDYIFAGQLATQFRNRVAKLESEIEEFDVDTILSILERNKVPLVFLDKGHWKAYPKFFEHPHFKEHYKIEHDLFENLRNDWTAVREKFLKTGIESMLIKSVGFFPYKSSNLDVLIKQDKREKAESILKELGYIQLHNVEEPYKTLFRKFDNGQASSVIHLHNKVAWINPFHDEELLWTRFRNSPEDSIVDIPSPEDSILILTAHWFYEDKEIKLSDIMKISACLKKDNLDWGYMKAVAEKQGWVEGFYFGLLALSFVEKKLFGESSIHESQLEKMRTKLPRWMRAYFSKKVYVRELSLPFKLPKIFGKGLHFVKTIRDKTTKPSRKLYELYKVAHGALFVTLFYKFKINIRHQRPMLISISGADGSGKTTYAKYLYDNLVFCELRTQYVWSRVGSSSFLKPFSKLAKLFFSSKKRKNLSKHSEYLEESEEGMENLFRGSPFLRTLGTFLLLLEMLVQYFFKVTLPLFFKKVVICDRYVYDTLIDITSRYGVVPNSLKGRLFTKILITLTPKPDIAYVLHVSFEDISKRRQMDDRESNLIRDQIILYQEITSIFKLHRIETNNKCVNDISGWLVYNAHIIYYNKCYNKWRPITKL